MVRLIEKFFVVLSQKYNYVTMPCYPFSVPLSVKPPMGMERHNFLM